jgi:methanogenic corrinoid protein MtbC1
MEEELADMDRQALIDELVEVLLGDDVDHLEWTVKVLDDGMEALEFFTEIFSPAMSAIGDMFGALEIFLPELVFCAEKAQEISKDVIQPIVKESGGDTSAKGKVVLCTVKGDLHDIGKNMVALMLEVNGYEVNNMGINVDPRDALNMAKDTGADILGLSALMTMSMPFMKECVELRNGLGMESLFKIGIGGAPITTEYAAAIGADAFGLNAVDAVRKFNGLMDDRQAEKGTVSQ